MQCWQHHCTAWSPAKQPLPAIVLVHATHMLKMPGLGIWGDLLCPVGGAEQCQRSCKAGVHRRATRMCSPGCVTLAGATSSLTAAQPLPYTACLSAGINEMFPSTWLCSPGHWMHAHAARLRSPDLLCCLCSGSQVNGDRDWMAGVSQADQVPTLSYTRVCLNECGCSPTSFVVNCAPSGLHQHKHCGALRLMSMTNWDATTMSAFQRASCWSVQATTCQQVCPAVQRTLIRSISAARSACICALT